jgi:hypothetical protein
MLELWLLWTGLLGYVTAKAWLHDWPWFERQAARWHSFIERDRRR